MNRRHLWRRLTAIAISSSLILPIIALNAPPAFADPYACSGNQSRGFTGRAPGTSSNETGVSATYTFPVDQNYDACGPYSDTRGQPSTWVGLTIGAGNIYATGSQPILQAGVFNNHGFANPNHYFWASGGCKINGVDSIPYPVDLGPAALLPFTMRVDAYTDHFDVVINGTVRVNELYTSALGQRIGCWATHTKDPLFLFEKYDHGDTFGTSSANQGHFSLMKRRYNNTWFNLNGDTCENENLATPHPESCLANGTNMFVYTQ